MYSHKLNIITKMLISQKTNNILRKKKGLANKWEICITFEKHTMKDLSNLHIQAVWKRLHCSIKFILKR